MPLLDSLKHFIIRRDWLRIIFFRYFPWRKFGLKTYFSNRKIRSQGAPDGYPIPPDVVMGLVTGTVSVDWYLTSGQAAGENILRILKKINRPINSLTDILDWGCGCGRVIRQLPNIEGQNLYGCDYNEELLSWSSCAFTHAHFELNDLAPPLPFSDDSFDLVYALSVFTHLSLDLHHQWMNELARVVRPDGLVLLTTHGKHYLSDLSLSELKSFNTDQLVLHHELYEGSNLCASYHPENFVRSEMAKKHGFEVIYFEEKGAHGLPFQDIYALRNMAVQ